MFKSLFCLKSLDSIDKYDEMASAVGLRVTGVRMGSALGWRGLEPSSSDNWTYRGTLFYPYSNISMIQSFNSFLSISLG